MSDKIKVGVRGQVVIPKKYRKKLNIETGIILEINATNEGLLLYHVYHTDRKKEGKQRQHALTLQSTSEKKEKLLYALRRSKCLRYSSCIMGAIEWRVKTEKKRRCPLT